MADSSLNVSLLRQKFPALDRDQVYFDNAGGSQVLADVVDAVSTYMSRTNVQLGASYPIGEQSTDSYEAAFQSAASYINAPRDSIVLGSSTTQLFRNASYALFNHISEDSEIIISSLDHEANIASWVALAELRNAKVVWWKPSPSPNPHLDPSDLVSLLTERTKLVACTHTSNILGTISPIRAIAETVREHAPDALLAVDAVAYAPHREVDVAALGVDLYAFSWYKVYGPHISMLYASQRARKAMTSLGHFFKTGDSAEEMLGLAGASYELLAGVPRVVSYLEGLANGVVGGLVADMRRAMGFGKKGDETPEKTDEKDDKRDKRQAIRVAFEKIAAHEEALQEKLLTYLTSKPHGVDITILGEPVPDAAKRVPVISFKVSGWKSKELVLAVQERSGDKLGFRWGSFYSNRLVKDVLALEDVDDGVVRVSLVHYNLVGEVEEFVRVLDKVLGE